AIAAGRAPNTMNESLWSEVFFEYDPVADEIVWEWHLWDHLIQDFDPARDNYGVVSEHPELVNINYFDPNPEIQDWIHVNTISYNPELDQILVSAREF